MRGYNNPSQQCAVSNYTFVHQEDRIEICLGRFTTEALVQRSAFWPLLLFITKYTVVNYYLYVLSVI